MLIALFPLQHIILKWRHAVSAFFSRETCTWPNVSHTTANKLQHQTKRRQLYITVKIILCFQKHVHRPTNWLIYHKSYSTDSHFSKNTFTSYLFFWPTTCTINTVISTVILFSFIITLCQIVSLSFLASIMNFDLK